MRPIYELLAGLFKILALGFGGFFVNVLLHELGHAIPMLIWSKKSVRVYVGSFGSPDRSLHLALGRVDLYIKYNPFLWLRGMCSPGERLPVRKMIFYTAMGPFTSLVVTAVCVLLLRRMGPDHDQTVVLVTFMAIGGMLTLSSAIPMSRLMPTHSGKTMRNDATQIFGLWKLRNMPDEYWEGVDRFGKKDYAGAVELLEQAIDKSKPNRQLYRSAVGAALTAGDYDRAVQWMELIRDNYRPLMEDELNEAAFFSMTGRHRDAITVIENLLRLHHNNFVLLNNMGYSLVAVGEAQNALFYLERGLTLAPRFAHLYAGRGWARMELGRWEEGMEDARYALELDDTLADGYRLYGLHALNSGDPEAARDWFLKAKATDHRVQFVDAPLAEAERQLASAGQIIRNAGA
jgi:Flp pilus assembly protein TadD